MDEKGSELSAKDHARIAQQFIEAIPHAKALELRVDDLGSGKAQISMPWAEYLVGDPRTGVIHGGVISTLMDTCSGAAVMAHPSGPRSTATIDLRIDYMRAATPRQRIVATAECYHMTRNVAFIRAVAVDEDSENPVATATGAFTVER
ncbi:PaaI family thioesterase [Paracoccus sp. 11-3]|uniref:PaaI family thioesterase n=1 Tax=Paracoccus amoyensis TaxID=2760093 RepID=A0A926JCY7_9RHOB|nr:PaaI family thioesterase [Paracoccus amoyensis]MBC9246924.1 PaaI family thioesterase [Paracoccus amoyensis]